MARQTEEVYEAPLNAFGDFVRVAIIREGKAVVHFVVEYEALVEGRHRPVIRYDCSHDRPHRDTLDWSGRVLHKRWLPEGITRNQALTYAITDIRHNWERYLDSFLRRRER